MAYKDYFLKFKPLMLPIDNKTKVGNICMKIGN